MRTEFYAYRRKSDGYSFLKDYRPYCTKGAAKQALKYVIGWRDLTEEEIARIPPGGYWHGRKKQRTKAEREAVIAEEFDLITYELREVA